MGKKLAYLRKRIINAKETFQVRWRELEENVLVMRSKSFLDFTEATTFCAIVQRRLGIVAVGKGMMADLMLPNGDVNMALEEFIHYLKVKNENYEYPSYIKYLIKRMADKFGWVNTKDITENSMNSVCEFYQGRTTCRYQTLQAIKRFLRWCSPNYAINENVIKYKVSRIKDHERILWTEDQVRAIFFELRRGLVEQPCVKHKAYSDEWKKSISFTQLSKIYPALLPLFRLLILWALRPKEATKLLVRHWDGSRNKLLIANTKTGYNRTITVDPETGRLLSELCRDQDREDVIFRTCRGEKWTRSYMSQVFQQILKKLNIPGSLYCTRHYAATRLIIQGNITRASVKSIMAITGHRTYSEFERYIHMCDSDLENIAKSGYGDFFNDEITTIDKPNPAVEPVTSPEPPIDFIDDSESGAAVSV